MVRVSEVEKIAMPRRQVMERIVKDKKKNLPRSDVEGRRTMAHKSAQGCILRNYVLTLDVDGIRGT